MGMDRGVQIVGEAGAMGFLARFFGAISFVTLAFSLGRWLRNRSLCWPALAVGAVAGGLAWWLSRWYLPPDNHVAVIYRLGRFRCLVGPEEIVWLWPLLDRVQATVGLALQRQEMALEQLPTQDGLPIDLRLAICYQRDLRVAPEGFVPQALSLGEDAWDTLVRDRAQEAVREQLAARSGAPLLLAQEQAYLRTQLCQALAERLRSIGVVLGPKAGLSLLDIRPARPVWEAMVDRVAAVPEGEAAQRRIQALLAEAKDRADAVAQATVLLAGAAAEVKDGAETHLVVGPAVPIVGPSPHRPTGVGSEPPSTRARR